MFVSMSPSPRHRFSAARRAVGAALAIALGAAILVPQAASGATGPAGEVFAMTNAERAKAGVSALVSNPGLDAAAAEWARHLASTCTFAHSSSQWRSSRIAAFGWVASGENIAAGQANAGAVMKSWMNSSGHRANILNTQYKGLGVGYATSDRCYRTYWVQIFAIGSPVKTLPGGAGDLTGDRIGDVVARTATGELRIYPGNGVGGFKPTIVVDKAWGSRPFTTLGDFTGDGIPDLARTEADGRLMLYAGTGRGGFRPPTRIGTGWAGFTQLIGGLDFNGDRLTDVLARTPAGDMMLYRGNGKGGFASGGTKIGSGWKTLNPIVHAGDFTGDARSDIITRRPDGTLWLYPTTGRGTWGTARKLGNGWSVMTAISGAGDFDGNGTQDVLARNGAGNLLLYPGNGRGGFLKSRTVGSAWSGISQIG